jgi:hypothetical protein
MYQAEHKDIPIVSQAQLVKSGVVRVMELQEKGWNYVKPCPRQGRSEPLPLRGYDVTRDAARYRSPVVRRDARQPCPSSVLTP